MTLNVCIAKIHRATVTDANLNYIGSITIGKELVEAAGLLPNQMVQITNLANGTLWRTYVLEGKPGEICLNGPPAHHFKKGDKVIIIGEAWVEEDLAKRIKPTIVFVDDQNKVTEVKEGNRR
ncbi:MAG TPA: aspartate 1-decarboxylase [Candidatus Paceibacterota bacterium]|nr:aspartate 1-decarboxylase [Candidatus Paceibacterota bacterium]